MSALGHVFDILKVMSLPQLLLAFLACIGYTVAQGGMLDTRGRQRAGLTALVATVAFTLLASDWMASIMLVAFAVAGLGVFVALAWLLSVWVAPADAGTVDADLTQPADVDAGFALSRATRNRAQSA